MLQVKYLLSNITYEGIYRKDNMEYPEEALREAIINAVIHRNYMGAHTQLRIDPEAGLPEPEFREEFGGLSVHFRKADKAQEAQVEAQEAQEAQVELLNWQREVMKYCFDDEKTGNEIMKIAGYSSRTGNFKKGLQRLLDYQLLELLSRPHQD